MLKIYAYTYFIYSIYYITLSGLSVVEMKPLNINGHVGGKVTFKCSDWNVWTDETFNVKYFCNSPCSEDDHTIVKAAFGQTTHKNRIKITNRAEGLFVTFTNLQKSDSKTYFCGLERSGFDSYIKVNLKVTDAVSSHHKTTPKAVDGATVSSAVTNSSSMSSTSSDVITENPTSYMTLNTTPAAQRAGSIPYLIIGVIIIVTTLMVLLKIMNKTMKKQLRPTNQHTEVVSSTDTPQEDTHEDVEYDEIRPEDQTDPDGLYANYSCHQVTELAAQSGNSYLNDVSLKSASRFETNSRGACEESRVTGQRCDLIYSVAQRPKEQTEPTVQSEPNQSENNENDFLYSLVQLPRAT